MLFDLNFNDSVNRWEFQSWRTCYQYYNSLYQWDVTRCERIKTFLITASKLANVEKGMKRWKLRKAIEETKR